ncbi:hypothetical protein [Flammeovirga sp. OC4]|uniref:hypothetical protein n=1 Tax=Flammeovirga sp. OC4 TaxID=1382345 RepID=UPI0005C5BD3A|nr:hypothetical protein [Flammeovirga sp. OC4]
MRNILTTIIFGLFCFGSSNVLAIDSKTIIIDVSIAIEQDGAITNLSRSQLEDGLYLKLTNLHASDRATDYVLDGGNFTDSDNLLNLSNQDLSISNRALIFNLTSLDRVEVNEGGSNIKLKVRYQGQNKPVICSTEDYFDLVINISDEVGNNSDEDDIGGGDCKTFTSVEIQKQAVDYVTSKTGYKKHHSKKTNLFLENNIVHIYIDENGNLIKTGIPTTAKESYLYQVHLLYEANYCDFAVYEFTYDGAYSPKFSILNTGEEETAELNSEDDDTEPVIKEIEFAVIGPFTDEFDIKIVKKVTGKKDRVLLNHKIDVAKLYHVSISTGLLFSSLRNPQNIETFTKANGETTLVADDPRDRGMLTIMATFYPWGRSFLFPPEGGVFDKSRFGIQVGTRLDSKAAENFFAGLSHDFARGGTFSYGLHYGRRNYVAGARNFDFGNDIFDLPELNVKQEWGVGFYVGVVIDTRVAGQLFKSLGGNNN